MSKLRVFFFLILIFFNGCSKNTTKISAIKENKQDLELISTYAQAYDAFNKGDTFFAAQKFLEAEMLFPQSKWAPKSALMASYSYYLQNYYSKALSNLERFIKTYPNSEDIVYAYYLSAMCYYENIIDEKRDLAPMIKAKQKFIFIINNYPDTDFASDAQFKINLIDDILASKEMYLGRHYIKKRKWIPAINRFKHIVKHYEKTIFIEEALHRLVELNYEIGLIEESKKYANVLGVNYQSSDWYQRSYKIFNKDYSLNISQNIKKDKKGVLSKFQKLFE